MTTLTKADRISLSELNRLLENLNHSENSSDKKIRIGLILQYYTGYDDSFSYGFSRFGHWRT